MFIVFARLNIKAGELKLGPNGHIKYQNEEISKESMAELGVLRGSVHYAELVRTLMAEFGVYLEDKGRPKKLQRHKLKLTRKHMESSVMIL